MEIRTLSRVPSLQTIYKPSLQFASLPQKREDSLALQQSTIAAFVEGRLKAYQQRTFLLDAKDWMKVKNILTKALISKQQEIPFLAPEEAYQQALNALIKTHWQDCVPQFVSNKNRIHFAKQLLEMLGIGAALTVPAALIFPGLLFEHAMSLSYIIAGISFGLSFHWDHKRKAQLLLLQEDLALKALLQDPSTEAKTGKA